MMLEIHRTKATDLKRIQELMVRVFGDDEGQEIGVLVADLWADATAKPMVSLVATMHGDLAGYILFTTVRITGSEVQAMILAPLAVEPSYQQRGVGGRLVEEGLAELKEMGVGLVFVLGHPSYYPRFGFLPAGPRGLNAPYPIPAEHVDAWMVQELDDGLIGKVTGTVTCAVSLDKPAYWQE